MNERRRMDSSWDGSGGVPMGRHRAPEDEKEEKEEAEPADEHSRTKEIS